MKITFLGLLAIVFITLKLIGVIDWSWWWVTCPLWGGLAVAFAVLIFMTFIIRPLLWCYFRFFRKKEFEQLKVFENRKKSKPGLAGRLEELQAERERIMKERSEI